MFTCVALVCVVPVFLRKVRAPVCVLPSSKCRRRHQQQHSESDERENKAAYRSVSISSTVSAALRHSLDGWIPFIGQVDRGARRADRLV